MSRRVHGAEKCLRHRRSPGGFLHSPAVDRWGQRRLHRHRTERLIGIDLNFAGAERLLKQDGRRRLTAGRRRDIAGHRIVVGLDGQHQIPVHNGSRLLNALVAHAVVEKGIHEEADLRSGFAGRHVTFQALPGDFVDGVVDFGRQIFDHRKGHDADAVIGQPSGAGFAPGLGHGCDSQHTGRHGWRLCVVFGRNTLHPGEGAVGRDTEAILARKALCVRDQNIRSLDGTGDGEPVIVHIGGCDGGRNVGIRHRIGRSDRRLGSGRRPVDRITRLLVIGAGGICGVPHDDRDN